MPDETTPEQPLVPQQNQPPSSRQLENLWEEEQATDFSSLREGLGQAVLNVDW